MTFSCPQAPDVSGLRPEGLWASKESIFFGGNNGARWFSFGTRTVLVKKGINFLKAFVVILQMTLNSAITRKVDIS